VATVSRPDGVELYWESRGEGPQVLFAGQLWDDPQVFAGLIAELAREHAVVTYDLRGTGRSTRTGPYELATDRDDLLAVAEQAGGAAVVVAVGDAAHRATEAAAARPDLIGAVVTPNGNPVGRWVLEGGEGLAASDSVVAAFQQLIKADYRAALRQAITDMNPQMSEQEIRDRLERTVANSPHESVLGRIEAWIAADSTEAARALGDRVWILGHHDNPWFPNEGLERTREVLPEAHIEILEDGPISRPDLTAGIVRQVTELARIAR
jgi:pimeloyl-ACP methyl ester carboxylesterase